MWPYWVIHPPSEPTTVIRLTVHGSVIGSPITGGKSWWLLKNRNVRQSQIMNVHNILTLVQSLTFCEPVSPSILNKQIVIPIVRDYCKILKVILNTWHLVTFSLW